MAIDLNRVNKNARRAVKAKVSQGAPKKVRRPWEDAKNSIETSWLSDELLFVADTNTSLFNFDSSSSRELLKIIFQHQWSKKMNEWQRKSYWISRLTHRESWWARLKIYPRFQFPLPSWLTQKP